jgi:hypothetical protein
MSSRSSRAAISPIAISVASPAGSILQLAHEGVHVGRALGALAGKRRERLRIVIAGDDAVPVLHQPARDVAAHPAQADHADAHRDLSGRASR